MNPAKHALLALLWSETDDDYRPLDCGDYSASPVLINTIDADWDSFRTQAEALGFDPAEALAEPLHPDCGGDPWAAVAHDFVMTRNHHGCGFWDGKWHAPWGEKLTALATTFSELHPVVGDDGLLYPL